MHSLSSRRSRSDGSAPRALRALLVLGATLGVASVALPAAAQADVWGTTFQSPTYAPGNINGQGGWMKTGAYDVNVANTSGFPAAAGYGFGAQVMQISSAVGSGSFGDQTFTPAVVDAAGESTASTGGYSGGVRQTHFDAQFRIGTASATEQTGNATPCATPSSPCLFMTVSPDRGDGSRMSYLRFEDHADGVHVFFDDVTDPGPVGTVANFNETDIATLNRTQSHLIDFSIDYKDGPGNDVVKISIDGAVKATGTTWEDYYRFDPEQAPANVVPTTDDLMFREGTSFTTPQPSLAGKGFLVDDIRLASSTPGANLGPIGPAGAAGPAGSPGSAGPIGPAGASTGVLGQTVSNTGLVTVVRRGSRSTSGGFDYVVCQTTKCEVLLTGGTLKVTPKRGRAKTYQLGDRVFTLATGQTRLIGYTLTGAERRALRGAHHAVLTTTVTIAGFNGRSTRYTRRVAITS